MRRFFFLDIAPNSFRYCLQAICPSRSTYTAPNNPLLFMFKRDLRTWKAGISIAFLRSAPLRVPTLLELGWITDIAFRPTKAASQVYGSSPASARDNATTGAARQLNFLQTAPPEPSRLLLWRSEQQAEHQRNPGIPTQVILPRRGAAAQWGGHYTHGVVSRHGLSSCSRLRTAPNPACRKRHCHR